MRQNKKILSKNDIELLYAHWGALVIKNMKKDLMVGDLNFKYGNLADLTGLQPSTFIRWLDYMEDPKFIPKIPAEKLISIFIALEIPFSEIVPSDFSASGTKEVSEVIKAIIDQHGPTQIGAVQKTIQEYFSVDSSWANEKLFECLEVSDQFVIEMGKIDFIGAEEMIDED